MAASARRPVLAGALCAGVFAVLLLASAPARALAVAGVEVPPVLRLGEQELHLQGAGVRTRLIFDVYVAALYVADRPTSVAALLDIASPRVITMHLLREIDADALIHALETGLSANNTPAELAPVRGDVERLLTVMREIQVAPKGSDIMLVFNPDGLVVRFAGRERGRIAQPALARALLKAWVGDHPAQESLRRALLGGL